MKRSLVCLAVLGLLLAGCGGTNQAASTTTSTAPPPDPLQVVLASAEKTTDEKTSKFSMTVSIPAVSSTPIQADGGFDYAHKTGTMTMHMPSVAGIDLGDIEMIMSSGVIYEKVREYFLRSSGETLDQDRLEPAEQRRWCQRELDRFQLAGDPSQALAMLENASGDVTAVGTEQLNGVSVTHYKATLDFSKLATNVPPAAQDAYRQLAKLYNGVTVPVDVWVDQDGRVRKITYSLNAGDFKVPNAASLGVITTSIELSDFGSPVSVTLPPPDQVSAA